MAWTRTPSLAILLWLSALIPFTVWDLAYIFLRPHSLPSGPWHRPVFAPYTAYAETDLIYGPSAWESGDGFVAAHCVLNLLAYALGSTYLWLVLMHGRKGIGMHNALGGAAGRRAALIVLVEGAMTATKTVTCGAQGSKVQSYMEVAHQMFSAV